MGDQFPPFLIEGDRRSRFGASSTVVPVAGVGKVAFLAMKVSVNQGSIGIWNTGAEVVGVVPALGPGQPERAEFDGELPGRSIAGLSGLIEFLGRHRGSS